MLDNILEYVVSDAFVQLWLTATEQESDHRCKEHWRPELVEQFTDPNDVPDAIIIDSPVIHTNNAGLFHFGKSSEPTVSFKEMKLIWGTESSNPEQKEGAYDLNRKQGPARIVLTDVKKWHNDGYIHRRRGDAVLCKQVTFTWATDGNYIRSGGPYHLSIREFQANGDKGSVTNIRLGSLVPSWATVNGRKLKQVVVRDTIKKYRLAVNLLAFDNVFENPEDEMVFLTEMAE